MKPKHQQGKPRRRGMAWPIIAFGLILVVGAARLLTRQGGASQSDSGGTPRIVVDQPKIDYGYVKFGETRTFRIAVTNTGTGPLRFTTKPYIEVLEGC